MKFTKTTFATALGLAAIALVGCGSDGDETIIEIIDNSTTTTTTTTGGDDGSSGSGVSEICPDWTTPKLRDADGSEVCALPGTILEDRTLTNDIVWLMEGTVTVGNGNLEMSATEGLLESGDDVLDVTLSIQQGTEIKGATGTFANMIITRGSTINATGTADAPIVFSSDDDDDTGAGEWGGLILHGYGEHNECFMTATCNVDAEGESGFAGGITADDSSGTLEYVIVNEGGYEFAEGNEINGISLVGVGSGTTMDYIQINGNADDGIEFYGGAVNVSHLVLTGNLDDSVDWDEGYQGNLQYVIVKQTPDAGGNAIEADTEGTTDFFSMPFIMNATFVGDGSKTDLHVFKASSGGFIFNSVMTGEAGTFANCALVDGTGANGNVNTRLFYENVIGDCTTFAQDDLGAAVSFSGMIDAVAADLNALYASQAPEAVLGAAVDLSAYDDAADDLLDNLTADLDFLEATSYLGAVDPAATEAWWEGWIVEGSL